MRFWKRDTEQYTNREDGRVKVYIPDGHIKTGGFYDIWAATMLPYPEEKDYVAELSELDLRKLGYPRDGVETLTVVVRRPHNIPESIKRGGAGVSGRDFFSDRLLGLIPQNESDFSSELEEKGLVDLLNLKCRPSYIVFAFPEDYDIKKIEDLRRKLKKLDPNIPLAATEFESIARSAAEEIAGLKKGEYMLLITDGKTETYPRVGDTHGMVDVTETGESIKRNRLLIAEPLVMERVTPHFVVDEDTYKAHKPVFDEMISRMEKRIEELNEERPEIFAVKLNREVIPAGI